MVHLWLGIPASLFAALAAIQFLEGDKFAALLAVMAAALSAVMTFLNPSDKVASHRSAGKAFSSLKNWARMFRQIEAPGLDDQRSGDGVTELAAELDQLNSTSPEIPRLAYLKAKKDIAAGAADYDASTLTWSPGMRMPSSQGPLATEQRSGGTAMSTRQSELKLTVSMTSSPFTSGRWLPGR